MKYVQCVQNVNVNTTPRETIEAIKKAGFDGAFIQWYNKDWSFSQEQQLKLCRELGLEIPFFHLGYSGINAIWVEGEEGEKLVEGYLRDLDACKRNDIDLVIMHPTSKFVAPKPNMLGIKRLQKIIDHAEKLNIKIAFENSKIFGYLEYIFEHIKNSNIGICFDIGHCHCHFDNKFNWKMFKNKILAVHLHDNDKSDDLHLLPFDGTVDWKKLAKDLKKAKYKGPVTLESCYRYNYLNMPVDDFYKLSLEKAKKIAL